MQPAFVQGLIAAGGGLTGRKEYLGSSLKLRTGVRAASFTFSPTAVSLPSRPRGRPRSTSPVPDGAAAQPAKPRKPKKKGVELLRDPRTMKGTAYTHEERQRLGLRGLLPPNFSNIKLQEQRYLGNMRRLTSDIDKYAHLQSLKDRNEVLYYHVISKNIVELMPLIYTPTVGEACARFGEIFQRPRGMYITLNDRGCIRSILDNWPEDDVRVIVVTDGERILGLGDLGSCGMGIPLGKLDLYVACAGIRPEHTLPILLDVGTNNLALQHDPFYPGLRHGRVRGENFDALMEEFVEAVQDKWGPGTLIQFEDFGNVNAFRVLKSFQDRGACVFNDDIQGTAAVALAAILSGLRMVGGALDDQRILFHGAGEAGTGIGELIVEALVQKGLPREEAARRCWFIDSHGLVTADRLADLQAHKRPFAHEPPAGSHIVDLLSAVKTLKPTVLVGVAAQSKAFTPEIIESMTAAAAERGTRPFIFALSNPTSKAECTAEEAYHYSQGACVFASGSPFAPLKFGRKHVRPAQANNAYIFPGVGLGIQFTGARSVPEAMFIVAAEALAAMTTDEDYEAECLFPSLERIRECSLAVAVAVAEYAYKHGLATRPQPGDLRAAIEASMYRPRYVDLVPSASSSHHHREESDVHMACPLPEEPAARAVPRPHTPTA